MGEVKRVLVVDDEDELRELLVEELTFAGFRAGAAANGNAALAVLADAVDDPYDFVLSDVRMPDGNGVELLDKLRARWPESPPLAFYSGYSDVQGDEAFDKGAVAVFPKPSETREIIDSIRWHLRPRRERWRMSSVEAGRAALERELPPLAEALESGALRFGAGGLFLRGAAGAPVVGRTVVFRFRLGDFPFEGAAVCRWARSADLPGLPAGMGLELLALTGPSLDVFEGRQRGATSPAYIPRR